MKRAVRMLIRLIASGIMVVGAMEFALEFMRHRVEKAPIHLENVILGAILIALGVALAAFSAKLAERWTDDFDE